MNLLSLLRLALKHPIIAFYGIKEFRSEWTKHYEEPEINSYDAGRELAHKLTFRKFETN